VSVVRPLQPECLHVPRGTEPGHANAWVGEGTVAKEDRGFASMDRNKQREIASKGGKAAHQKGTAHEWTSEEAREAGRKGGMASHRRKQQQQPGEESPNSGSESLPETIGNDFPH
jgi:uncharacterized protein